MPVYERIGDTRSRAVTMGKIADILARQGQVVEALSLWLEALPVFESIQEPFSIGFAAIRIAQLQHFADEDSAARISLDKAESAFSSVDNADGVAACQKLRRAWFEER
ncbi:hypothetical protein SAMN02745244_02918 [Tessaracoccus bendigoensis DSM 12906]|uniref:Tetratricopeptide repeat-containing protein n=1 Tax=Tessaracoccus bendigoensis DSM 12906 TaxID=1123357 RepID=A0A1M6KUL0_9ACTN|nr:hypothetical protein SAMN02745244_02918 [Tessaracoccus bendigoensis DSM 12906]